jgi:hypothetical protein
MSVEDFTDLRARALAHRVPGGELAVPAHVRGVAHAAMLAPPLPAPTLHPVWALVGSITGMGETMERLTAAAEPRPEDRILFGETELDMTTPLKAGERYRVDGEVEDLSRRVGRRAGVMDRLTVRLRVRPAGQPEGAAHAEVVLVFLILRGGQS